MFVSIPLVICYAVGSNAMVVHVMQTLANMLWVPHIDKQHSGKIPCCGCNEVL